MLHTVKYLNLSASIKRKGDKMITEGVMSSIREQISRVDDRLGITFTTEVYPSQILVQCRNGKRLQNYWFDLEGNNVTPGYVRE